MAVDVTVENEKISKYQELMTQSATSASWYSVETNREMKDFCCDSGLFRFLNHRGGTVGSQLGCRRTEERDS